MGPHKALFIPDILHEIFKHLASCPQLSLPDEDMGIFQFPEDLDRNNPPHDTYKTRRLTLARAARTCKAFTNSASRVLWEVLDEIEHIISVLRTAQVSHSCNSVFFRNAEVARHLTAKWTPPVVHDSRTFAAASALCRSRLDHRKPWATCSR